MNLIKPFAGLRPQPQHVEQVIAPPYDVLSSDEARVRAKDKPYSFLHISKPEIDLPASTAADDPAVYAKGAENFKNMLSQHILKQDGTACYYVYRITMGDHQQTGFFAAASVNAYQQNLIRKHELTRPKKENDRVNQIKALKAQTGPVLLTYKQRADVETLLSTVTNNPATVDVVADDNVRHQLWVMDDTALIKQLTDIFSAVECLYIADGHHRSAAAARVCDNNEGSFLAALFPDNELQILDYNRVITDLNDMSEADFLQAVAENFTVTRRQQNCKPQHAGQFAMYLAGQWYQLEIKPELIAQHDVIASLDISLLSNYLIEPILNISDPRRDDRIDFIGGSRGLAELQQRVDSGNMTVAFALFPTPIADLFKVADANEVMPPKSTWFAPKLADGLVSYLL